MNIDITSIIFIGTWYIVGFVSGSLLTIIVKSWWSYKDAKKKN